MKYNLAIIPARGGSKRIINKNLKKFNNIPIISYSLDVIKKSKLFEKIHVSSDSNKIINYADKFLSQKTDFIRPASLSKDITPIFDVLRYVFYKYEKKKIKFENILLMTPCSPLITVKDIKNCFKILKLNNYKNPIISVSELPIPIEYAYVQNKKKILEPLFFNKISTNSNKFKKVYYDTGNIILLNRKHILNSSNIKSLYLNFKPYILPKYRSVDIDNLEDWKYAELLKKINMK